MSSVPSDQVIVSEYRKTLSAYKAAKSLGINWKTVYRALDREGVTASGLDSYRKQARAYSPDVEAEVVGLYKQGLHARQIIEKHGGSISSVIEVLRRAGVTRRSGHVAQIPEDEAKEICAKYQGGMTTVALSTVYNRGYETICAILRRNAIPIRRQKTNIKRGHYRHRRDGYVFIRLEPSDPFYSMTGARGMVFEHRLVMARKFGRVLLPSETVHHINGDKTDNRPENLELRQGKHGKHIVMCCVDCGSRNIQPVALGATV